MFNSVCKLKGLAAVLTATLAVGGAGSASAKMLATNVADFTFDQETVLYTTPSPDQVVMEITANNEVLLVSVNQAEVTSGPNGTGDVLGTLNLGSNVSGGSYRGQYVMFGTLTDGDSSSTSSLVSGSLDAMQTRSDGQSLEFLFTGGPATGADGTLYQSVGIFAQVFGLSSDEWARQYALNGASSLVNLIAAESPTLESAPAAPVPATAYLVLAGLFGLSRFARRRG